MQSISFSERGPRSASAISVECDAWPIIVCRVLHRPSDEEVIACLREQELLLDRSLHHAVLIARCPSYEPRLDHVVLWRSFEQVHARRLDRFCLGRAFVTPLPGARSFEPRPTRVPERSFDDEASARMWLAERLTERTS